MAQVTVKINGYAYTVGCDDGQEQHLLAMAEQVENRIAGIRAVGGGSGESRLLVLAALLMADEIHDMKAELDAARAAAARTAKREARAGAGGDSAKAEGEVARKLNRLAVRAEDIANGLERGG